MKLKYFTLFFGIFFIGFSSASINFCIDHTIPTTPTNLHASGTMFDLIISWDASIDGPSCSSTIYLVYKNGNYFLNTTNTTFSDSLTYGTTTYSVYATDLAGHKGDAANLTLNYFDDTTPSSGGGSGGGGSSGGSSSGYIENCTNWTPCIDNIQNQTCYSNNNPVLTIRNCVQNNTNETTNIENISNNSTSSANSTLNIQDSRKGLFSITGNAIRTVGEISSKPAVYIPTGFVLILGVLFFVVKKKNRKAK
jgi:hypothetical protein